MTTPDALYETLVRSLNDWPSRCVLADWYEETGEQDAADAVRWMVRAQKRPYRTGDGPFVWFNAGRATCDTDPESDLPEAVYLRLCGAEGLPLNYRIYETLRAADEDFHQAWRGAREEGWEDAP